MDTSCAGTGAGNSSQQQTCKRKFFQWAVKWFYANISEDMQEKPDVPLLATLLQSIGFQLREFERSEVASVVDGPRPKKDNVKVIIECGNSGMRACLEIDDVKCRCPNHEDAKDASFWSVSGTGPTNAAAIESVNKIEESGSNLLPPVSKETAKMINDVIYHLFNIIGDKSVADVNQNSKSRSNLNLSRAENGKDSRYQNDESFHGNDSLNIVRSHTQPEIILNTSNIGTRRKPFNKETTSGWGETMDIERASIDSDQPRSSPPKIASSPVFILNELCSSLDSISVQSEDDAAGSIATYVVQAHKSLEKALEIIAARRSPTHENAAFLKPVARGSNSRVRDTSRKRNSDSTGSLKISPTGTNSRPGSSCSMPSRGYAALSLPRSNALSSSVPSKSSTTTRRSVGSVLTKMSIAAKVTAATTSADNADAAGSNKNAQSNAPGASKIPGRRKSFHSLGPLKLAAVSAKNAAAATTQKNSTSPSPSNERSNAAGGGATSQSAIPKLGLSISQSASTIPTLKVAPLRTPGQKETKENSRRSVGNPRFGYGSKKT